MRALHIWTRRTSILHRRLSTVVVEPSSIQQSATKAERRFEAARLPLTTGRLRLVILGTGWAACRLLRDIDPRKYDVTVISPRNHMIFTPLLASTTVGTLDPRSVTVHITQIQKALLEPQNQYYMASCDNIDLQNRKVQCNADGVRFNVPYDRLAICTGSQGSTFGIPGVEKYTHFLRDVPQATKIRSKLIENLGRAALPGNSQEDFIRYLTVVIVGGGPTGVEFAGELCDFVREDLHRLYPHRARSIRVILIEAQEVLGSFDPGLREYAAKRLVKQGVFLVKGKVKEVRQSTIHLDNDSVIPFGLCVWSTGVGPTKFISTLPMAKTAHGRLAVNDYLQTMKSQNGELSSSEEMEAIDGVYALGDCCANASKPLPALAQVAEQQGLYLAKILNAKHYDNNERIEPFVYHHLGSMATVGRMTAILQLTDRQLSFAGFSSWIAWRSAFQLVDYNALRTRLIQMVNIPKPTSGVSPRRDIR